MKGFVGVSDYDWFAFLAQQPGIDEVNFWLKRQIRWISNPRPCLWLISNRLCTCEGNKISKPSKVFS